MSERSHYLESTLGFNEKFNPWSPPGYADAKGNYGYWS